MKKLRYKLGRLLYKLANIILPIQTIDIDIDKDEEMIIQRKKKQKNYF
jgi:hypothetical protein